MATVLHVTLMNAPFRVDSGLTPNPVLMPKTTVVQTPSFTYSFHSLILHVPTYILSDIPYTSYLIHRPG
jgi:hypothetical protein